MTGNNTKSFLHRAIRIAAWFLVALVGLIVLVVVALQFPSVQRYIAQKAVASIAEKAHTRIEIGSVDIAFTHSVVLHDVFVEDQQHDTLLAVQTLAVDVNLLGILSNSINVSNIRIDTLTAHITRTLPDSSFNFDFILAALSSDSTSASKPDTSASGWSINLGGLNLNGIHATYIDEVSGMNMSVQLGTMDVSMDKFDLDKEQFHVSKASLENTTANITQTKESPPDTSASSNLDLWFGTITLANLHLNYENKVTNERYAAELGTSELVADKIDLRSHAVALKKFHLANTNIVVVQPKAVGRQMAKSNSSAAPWVISLDDLNLNNNSARFDVRGTTHVKGLDPNHLQLNGLTLEATNIFFSENRMSANIHHTSFREHSGLELRELSGRFVLDSLHTELSNFTIETPGSRIHQDIVLSYSSISALKNLSENVHVKATVGKSHVAISDILFFQPSLPIRHKPGSTIRFSSKFSGLVRDLRVEEFKLEAGDSTRVDLAGAIRGLPHAETANYDINLRLLSSGRNDIVALVADTLLPKNIVLPASIHMTGNFKGTTKNFSAYFAVSTSIGSVKGNVALNSANGSKSSRWKTDVTVNEFNVGLLLNDTETFGAVSLKASAFGTGLKKEDIEAQMSLEVDKAVLNGYPYRNLTASGTVGPKLFEGKAEIQDSNIAFTFNGTVNTSEENPTYKFKFDLKGADLQQLHLTTDDMRVSAVITSDLTGKNVNDINGNIDIRNVVIVKNQKRYTIDSLLYASVNKEKETHLSFESSVLEAKFDGTIALGDLPAALKNHFNRYFALHDTTLTEAVSSQSFTFKVTLRDPRMLTEVFFPQLDRLSAGAIEGNYDSRKRELNLNVVVSTVDYNNLQIDSLTLKVASDAKQLGVTVRVGSIADSLLHITNLQLTAAVQNDSIDVALRSDGESDSTKILLAGVFNSVPTGYQFRFKPDGVVFQNSKWSVPSDGYLLFGKQQFIAHNVVLRGEGQSLSVNSIEQKSGKPPLEIAFSNFHLATLSRVVERDSGLVRGILNGNVVLRNLEKQMAFTSDLTVKDFTFSQRLVGDVRLRANNQTANVYEVNMDITGNDNDIAMLGKYISKEGGSELNLNLNFKKMNLAIVEPFTFGSVRRLSGDMSGQLHMTGTFKQPSITGNLRFTNTAFNPTMLDSYFKVENGEIIFDGKGVHFGSFVLIDSLGNKASLTGNLLTENFRQFRYDFALHTKNFLLMNKPAGRDALYYGTIFLDSDIFVGGDKEKPVIRMQAKLVKGTDVAVVMPESATAIEQRRGIVHFVDVANPANPIMSRRKANGAPERDTSRTKLSAIDLSSNVEVNKDSRIRILIDPIAGDSLVIRGEATFSVGVDPSGKLAVTGRYEIQEGSYQLSFGQFIRREFAIQKGSSLTWFGSVTEANMDITAIYTVKTSALDLVQNQLVGLGQQERNKYKQELRFQVYLIMTGGLLKPTIHFRLDLPPDQRSALGGSIYAKLNEVNGQESELNKQVFALLILGRFVSSNPLASASDGGLSGFARSSVSQILTEQLNRLSEKFIKGVSLNVGVESYQDYSSGTAEGRTQLQLALSKQLFDERVTVQVGGNVDLEGQRSQQNSLNNFAGDIRVGYKLTEDGRWQLQVFRQNTYGGAIEGDLIETGVGIVFTIDYDKLKGFTLKPISDVEEEK